MAVNVKFVGALRHITGKPQITVDYSTGFSIKELIHKLVQNAPEIKTSIIDQQIDGTIKTNALILVNDREISVLNGLDTLLCEGDEVVFVPVVHGG
ncbi:MAG: MoaD/ThiS family protein [Candidatus Bathyarchaeia archaeon]|jgi:MoaD family protein